MSLTSLRTKMMEAFRTRMLIFMCLCGFIFLVFFIQIVNLTLLQGSDYEAKARMNMEDYIPITAARGEIFDRTFAPDGKNKLLVSNRPSFNISVVPAKFKNDNERSIVLHRLGKLLSITYDDIEKELKDKNPWQRYIIKEDVTFDTIVWIASYPELFPNVLYEDSPVRVYNFGPIFSHTIGYIGSIDQKEYDKLKFNGYKYYQKIGKSGIEKQYDEDLRGTDGFIRRIVDVKSRTGGEEIGKESMPGNNLVLNIDYEVQRTIYEALGDQTGTAIVMKAGTGEVIALVSKPDYDPNEVISKTNSVVISDLQNDIKKPFLLRAIQSKYPPASTFKLVTSIAGLEEEKWTPNNTYYCSGKFTLKGYIDKDFYCYDSHGTLDLYRAIAKSCSAYFYNMGYKIGPTVIMKYAEQFGYASTTGIDLPGEISGFVPSKKYKLKTFGQPWFDGDTINLAIGQGFTSVTPIEVAGLVSAIVTNGVMHRPHVVGKILSPGDNAVIKVIKPEVIREVPLSSSTLDTVRSGMRLSVLEGTNMRLRGLKVPIAGKTGTAQTRSKRKDDDSQHAWFAGYAPYGGDPESAIVVVVMIEYGVAGAATATPVAEQAFQKMIMQGYFNESTK